MKNLILALALVLVFASSALADDFFQQIQVSDETFQLDMQMTTTYDIHITNNGHCSLYVSNYYFERYNTDIDPLMPGRILWTTILPGKFLDLKNFFGPLFAVCAKNHTARVSLIIRGN